MSKPRTLRSWRFLGVMAGCFAFCLLAGVLALQAVGDGEAPLRAVVLGIGLLALALPALFFLRTRVVMDEAGVGLVWAFRRYRFRWDEITEITADADIRYWRLQVRSAEREHMAALFPVSIWANTPDRGTRLYEPSGDAPYGLYKLHAELWERWQEHAGDQSFSTGA